MYKYKIGEKVVLKQFGMTRRKKVIDRMKNDYGNHYLLENELAWVSEKSISK